MIEFTVFPFARVLVEKKGPEPTKLPFTNQVYVGDAPPLTGVGLNVTELPTHVVDEGVAAIVTEGVTAVCIERLPKLVPVAPVTIPATPKSDEAKILPAAEPDDVACICRFEIVTTSKFAVPDALKLRDNAPALMLITPIETSPPLAVTVGSDTTNVHPAGGDNVIELAPVGKSVWAPSAIVIVPSVVGEVATVLQILVPPDAGVTVTAEKPV